MADAARGGWKRFFILCDTVKDESSRLAIETDERFCNTGGLGLGYWSGRLQIQCNICIEMSSVDSLPRG